jgi:hypothetical protein
MFLKTPQEQFILDVGFFYRLEQVQHACRFSEWQGKHAQADLSDLDHTSFLHR